MPRKTELRHPILRYDWSHRLGRTWSRCFAYSADNCALCNGGPWSAPCPMLAATRSTVTMSPKTLSFMGFSLPCFGLAKAHATHALTPLWAPGPAPRLAEPGQGFRILLF